MSEGVLAPRSASPPYVLDAINKAADLKPGDVFYDLGCGGDARIVIALAQAAAERAAALTQPLLQHSSSTAGSTPADHAPQIQPPCSGQATCGNAATAPAARHQQQAPPAANTSSDASVLAAGSSPLQQQQQQQQQTLPRTAAGRLTAEEEPSSKAADQQAASGPMFVGVELDEQAAAKAAAAVARLPADVQAKIRIVQGDLLQVPLHDATVVYAYLLPKGLLLLAEKLQRELRPGSVVLTYMFKMPGWHGACLPVTSGLANKPDVSAVSKLFVYKKT